METEQTATGGSVHMSLPILELRDVWKLYGLTAALAGVSLRVAAGEALLLYGPNGAGKSTLLRSLASLIRPSQGDILWRGERTVKQLEKYRRAVGFVSHASFLYPDLTPRENLRFFAKLFGLDFDDGWCETALESFGMQRRADDPVRNLSRGLQQRVSLARALIHDPEILLLDEPFTGLDEASVELFIERLRRERERGRCIFLATHNFKRGAAVARRLLRMDQGRVVHDGSVNNGQVSD